MRLRSEFRRLSYFEKSAYTNPHLGLRSKAFLNRSHFFSTWKPSNISTSTVLDITKPFTIDGVNYFQASSDFSPVGTVIDIALRKQNSAAFVAAFNSSYTEIYIPPGRYVFDTYAYMAYNSANGLTKRIYGQLDTKFSKDPNFNTILDTTFFNPVFNGTNRSNFLEFYGAAREIETTNSSIESGNDTTYRFFIPNTSNLKPGDLLLISDPNNFSYGIREYYKKGEILQIKTIDSLTEKVTFDCIDNYRSGCKLYKLDTVSVNIENIHITAKKNNNDPIDPRATTSIALSFGRDSNITNVIIDESSYYIGLDFHNCYKCNVLSGSFNVNKVNTHIYTPPKTDNNPTPVPITVLDNAYGVSFTHCQSISVKDIKAESHWHAIATGGGAANEVIVNRFIDIQDSTFTRKIISQFPEAGAAANFHGNTELSGFTGCTLVNSGFNIGGHKNYYIKNNVFPNSRDPNVLQAHDIGFQFDENLSLSFTLIGNSVKITGFRRQKISANENIFAEFLFLGKIERSDSRWPLPDDCKLVVKNNTFELDCSNDNLPAGNYSNSRAIFIGTISMPINYQSIFPRMKVEIAGNTFNIIKKPDNVSMSIDICGENGTMNAKENERRRKANDPKDPPLYWSTIKNIRISNNKFTFISQAVNGMPLLNPVDSESDEVIIENNDLSTKGSEGVKQLVKVSQAKSVTLKYNTLVGVPNQPNLSFENFTDIDPPLSDYHTNTYNGHT